MENGSLLVRASEIARRVGDLDQLYGVASLGPMSPVPVADISHGSGMVGPGKNIAHLMFSVVDADFKEGGSFAVIRDALLRLGCDPDQATFRALAASWALHLPITTYSLGSRDLWEHTIACAICSRTIAVDFDLWDPDEAFLAGLLHDVGLAALEIFARSRPTIARLIRTSDYPSYVAEQMVLGFDHAYLSSLICRQWGLMADVSRATAAHHEPLASEGTVKLAAIVHLADVISVGSGLFSYNPFESASIDEGVVASLGLKPAGMMLLAAKLHAYVRNSKDLIY